MEVEANACLLHDAGAIINELLTLMAKSKSFVLCLRQRVSLGCRRVT